MMLMPCFLKSAVVRSRNRVCSRSIELPSRTVYVLSSKQRESLATFLTSAGRFGPHGGVGAAGGAPRPACAAGAPAALCAWASATVNPRHAAIRQTAPANVDAFFMFPPAEPISLALE